MKGIHKAGVGLLVIVTAVLAVMALPALVMQAQEPRVVQITADHDNKFKVSGQKDAVITLKPKEVVKLRITAHKGTETDPNHPGCVHTFTVKQLKDQGWDLCLKEGMNEAVLVAPSEPGEYSAECLAKCGKGHDDMAMKVVVK